MYLKWSKNFKVSLIVFNINWGTNLRINNSLWHSFDIMRCKYFLTFLKINWIHVVLSQCHILFVTHGSWHVVEFKWPTSHWHRFASHIQHLWQTCWPNIQTKLNWLIQMNQCQIVIQWFLRILWMQYYFSYFNIQWFVGFCVWSIIEIT